MLNVESNFIEMYMQSVQQSVSAFLPLIGATVGLFLAFAIANSLRFFIQKMATKR